MIKSQKMLEEEDLYNEEISEIYYPIIKPFVAKEYLLLNDQNENRTTVENRYFFEVG